MLIGYARISSRDQNLDMQLESLRKAGCERIYADQISGKTLQRPQFKAAIEQLRAGDTLVVWKLDRLGRNVKDLLLFMDELKKSGVHFRSLTDAIDTATPGGRFFFHMMAALAQMERELIVERTRAGLAVARARGRIGGRKRKMTPRKLEAAKNLLKSGTPPMEVAQNLSISVPTLYRWIPAGKLLKD
jgi:DNA invertase Pin-like site-specific DNA recombinase